MVNGMTGINTIEDNGAIRFEHGRYEIDEQAQRGFFDMSVCGWKGHSGEIWFSLHRLTAGDALLECL